MAIDRLARMHALFGKNEKLRCGDCRNLIRVDIGQRTVFKCLFYGNTASEASDWRLRYTACGNFNAPIPRAWKPLIHVSAKKDTDNDGPIEGQITLEELLNEQ